MHGPDAAAQPHLKGIRPYACCTAAATHRHGANDDRDDPTDMTSGPPIFAVDESRSASLGICIRTFSSAGVLASRC